MQKYLKINKFNERIKMKNNKKIGILTFHSVSNYGAVLQAYALNKTILDKGYDCEIIDYQNNVMKKEYNVFSKSKINLKHPRLMLNDILMIPYIKKRNKIFSKFRENYLNISQKKYNENSFPDENEYVGIIAGSDQIWNFNCNGNDRHYFLDFVDKSKSQCYSYAASLGAKSLSDNTKSIYKELLKGFKEISVREHSAALLLKDILDRDIITSIDPTLLLTKKAWEELKKDTMEKNYVLVFLMSHSDEILLHAYQFAKKKKKKLIYVNMYKARQPKYYNSIYSATPQEWLGLIANADYIITNSFHGTVFSIIFERQFTVLPIKDKGKNERLIQLLGITGLEERLQDSSKDFVENTINYTVVNKNIEKARKKDLLYIDHILEAVFQTKK